MRKKDLEQIKEQIKRERKENRKKTLSNLEPDITFSNKLSATLIIKDLHVNTIYKLIKIKHMDQMLDTMWESTISEYNLHEPTVRRMLIKEERDEIENLILSRLGRKVRIQV